jgi:hypothetical protein
MSTRVIQVRPSRNPRWQKQGREVFEAEGVQPVYCGENGRQNALDYAQQRARSGLCHIRVLDENWNVSETIANEDLKPVI